MDHVTWWQRPSLRSPVMVAAFTGWNDAGDAASLAVRHLIDGFRAERFASLDPEDFYDFQQTRPQVRLAGGVAREIVWPSNDLYAASTPGGDVVLLLGAEPQLRWPTFCKEVLQVAKTLDVRILVTLGALLADVPHSRPVSIIGTSSDSAMINRFNLQHSRYEGPTGIVGVLHDACSKASVSSLSLWAAVPAYAAGTPSPKAALALVHAACGVVGAPVVAGGLARASRRYEDEVDEIVATDDDLIGYVRRLEAIADGEEDPDDDDDLDDQVDDDDEDEDDDEPDELGVMRQPGSAERLVEEVERYLRDQGDEPPR